MRGEEYFRGDFPVLSRRGAEHHFAAAGQSSRDGKHQNGGEEGSGASGDVEPDLSYGYGFLDASHSRAGLDLDSNRFLRQVEGLYVGRRDGYGFLDLGAHGGFRLGEIFSAQCQLFNFSSVYLLGKFLQLGIASSPYPFNDCLHPFLHQGVAGGWPAAEFRPEGSFWSDVRFHILKE